MKTLYILDAAGYIYRSYFAIKNMTNSKGESTNALFGFIRSILKLYKDFQPEHLVAVFDGPSNTQTRSLIYKDYKAHRAKMPPDLLHQIEWAKKFCHFMGISHLAVTGVEADDTMGSIACWAEQKGAQVFLCTSDKDMAQLVNDHIFILNTHKDNLILDQKGVENTYGVPPHLIKDFLSMTGDSSDNIPGIAGFGPKTASDLLNRHGSLEYILDHPEVITNSKKRELLIQETDNAKLSKLLVAIDTKVDFPKDAAFFLIKPKDKLALKGFFTEMNFSSLIREMDGLTEVTVKEEDHLYHLIQNEDDFRQLINQLTKHKEIAFSVFRTNARPLQTDIAGIGFGVCPKQAWYIPFNGSLPITLLEKELKQLFNNPAIGFFGHNIKYDLHALANRGIIINHIVFDTMLASYILNSHSRQHSLDQLALDYFGKVKIQANLFLGKGKKQLSLLQVNAQDVLEFCCEEVDYICRLKGILQPQLKERHLERLYNELELPLLSVLEKVEHHGIFLDVPCLETFAIQLNKDLRQLSEEIYALAGEEFNLNSPKQLSVILFEKLKIKPPKKTATGLSTNAEVLEFLKNDYPIAGKLQEYRVLEKLRSTYVEALPQEVNPHTGRIHPTFNQFVAATGRLSCQDPNLQNIPVRTEVGRKIREAFRPQLDGWSYLAADYSQIELRLLAHLSEDPILINAFMHNEDIHTHTAAAIFNIPIDKVTREERYRAKAVNFGIIYGQQAFGLSQEIGVEVKEAAKFIDTYFHKYPRVKAFLESCKDLARTTGKAVTMTGRERAIPEIHSKNMMIRSAAERLAVNTPFQGTAADIIKMAMLKVDKAIEENHLKGYMILQIHDELIFEVPDEEIPLFESLVRDAMQNVLKLRVPLTVDIALGKNWKEC
ncbi:MAG: DNA polymerase I [Parachlamydiaceae bacterium]